jgi:iron complex outermembrane receptor protein
MDLNGRLRFLMVSAAISALCAGTAMAQAPAPAPAAADAAGSAADESIVVTARRRSETLFEAPATVTAVSGKTLRDSNIIAVRDIVALIPNAVIQDDSESYNMYINIRGMRLVDVQAEPNFGLFRNGLYVGGHRSNLGAQVDIQRVEVLRGPQGGLYGRNAVGGAVNIIYATPDDEFGGYVRGSYGSYDRFEVEGAVNAPVSDNAAIRLTAWHFNQTGSEIYNETLDEDVLANSDHGVRGQLSVDITDKINVSWLAEYQETEGPTLRTYAPLGVVNGGFRSTPETYDLIRRDTPSIAETRTSYFSQKITFDTDLGEIALNASYREYRFDGISDSDQTNIPITQGTAVRKTDILRGEGTQNTYLEAIWTSPDDRPFTWIVGVSYFDETFDFSRIIQSNRDLRPQGLGTPRYWIGFPKPGTNVQTEAISAFASATYNFTDAFSVSAGLRWSQDTKHLQFYQGILPEGTVPQGNAALNAFLVTAIGAIYPNYNLDLESEFTFTAPSLSFKYEVNDDINIYATYSTGFRPGAFNLSPTTVDTIPYDMESATNYEIGVKSRWLDGQLLVNLAVFYMRQDDLLLAQTTQLGGVDRTYLANVGTADNYGVELEITGRIADWLTGGLSVGWLDAKFDEAIANPGKPSQLILNGLVLPATRTWTVNARLDADIPVSDGVAIVGSIAYRYEAGGMIGDYYIVYDYPTMNKIDLTAGVLLNDQVRITGYVHNLLDEHINQFYYYNTATNVSEGRKLGLSVSYDF